MDLKQYQLLAMKTALPTAMNTTYMTLNLAAEAGEVAGKAAKARRDDWSHAQLRDTIAPELGDVLWQLAGVCEVLGLSLDEVALSNLAKLKDRANRGTITGSGDTR